MFQVEEWKEFFERNKETDVFNHIAISSGISQKDFDKVRFKIRQRLNGGVCRGEHIHDIGFMLYLTYPFVGILLGGEILCGPYRHLRMTTRISLASLRD